VNYKILDVIDTLGELYYRAIIDDLSSQPMLSLIQHSEVPSCEECKRFVEYHTLSTKPDGTPFYVYDRIRPLYPTCKTGREISLQWFIKEHCIIHTRIRPMRHALTTESVFRHRKAS